MKRYVQWPWLTTQVFLLHTLRNPENAHGLGSIDSKNDTIDVRLDLIPARTFKSAKKTRKPTEVNVSITQNVRPFVALT